MSTTCNRTPAAAPIGNLQARFLSILPRIELHARIYFRAIKCGFKRADLIAEAVAVAWKWFIRMAEKGKDATRFPSVLATLAARAVKSGRKVAGQIKAKDVMNEQTQQRRGFVVGKLPDHSTLNTNPLMEALVDNTRSPIPDQVCFRQDFPRWVRRHCRRDRRIIRGMVMGDRTLDLSRKHQLSEGRISQLRRQFRDDWQRFHGELDSPVAAAMR